MKTVRTSFLERLRLTWVIARKDLREAVRNRNTLTVIASAFFIVALYRLLPSLSSGTHAPELIVYDPGTSQIIAQVEAGSAFYLVQYPSQERMLQRVASSEAPYLGLDIPEDFDEQAVAGQAQELQGYTVYWTSTTKAAQIRQAAEVELTRLVGAPVSVRAELTPVYPEFGENVLGDWAALTLVFALMMISIQLIPNLMLEEKNTRTLDALLVSPASAWELAAGKALAGLFYGLLAAVVIVAVFYTALIQFLPILLAILLGGFFMALVGLWTGLRVDSRGQLSFYVIGWIGALFIPVVVYQLSDLFAGGLREALRWLPGNLIFRLVQASFTQELPWQGVLLDAAGLLIWTLLAGAGLIWQIRRLDLAPGWKAAAGPAQSMANGSVVEIVPQASPTELKLIWNPAAAAPIPTQPLRLLGTLAAKDLREALHNKIILAILLTSLLLVGINSGVPLLLRSTTGVDFSAGQSSTILLMAIFQILALGIALTPVLFVEEKETHTLEALLASPASPTQIVAGKAAVGALYGLLGVGLIVLLNSYLFVRWDVLALGLLASLAFSVSLGLLLGVHCENPANLGLWGGMLILFLTASTLASAFQGPQYPDWLSAVLKWLPGSAMLQLMKAAMQPSPEMLNVLMNAGLLLVMGALFMFLTIRKVRSWR